VTIGSLQLATAVQEEHEMKSAKFSHLGMGAFPQSASCDVLWPDRILLEMQLSPETTDQS